MTWQTAQLTPPADRIDLGIGQPDPSLLPVQLFDQASIDAASLAYGAEAGDERFRHALAGWLSQRQTQAVNPGHLLVTNGASNALDMICTRFSKPGDTVLVEDPTYFIARKQLADHGLNVIAVPMDEDGVDVLTLAAQIKAHQPAFFYTIPTFHNPTGITQSQERREQLVALARKTGCLVAADEVYQHLFYGEAPPDPLASIDAGAPILSIGSFSKLLAPGLRLGWIQGQGSVLDTLTTSALLASGGGLAPVTSTLVRPLLEDGRFDQHLARLTGILEGRLTTLAHSLQEQLGDRLELSVPSGGYFIWAKWVGGVDTIQLLSKAQRAGTGFQPGGYFSDSSSLASAMRLCFAYYDETQLSEACVRLGKL